MMRPITQFEFAAIVQDVTVADENGDLAGEIGALSALRRLLDDLLNEAVSDYRTRGATWEQVATARGLSRQAVQKRHG